MQSFCLAALVFRRHCVWVGIWDSTRWPKGIPVIYVNGPEAIGGVDVSPLAKQKRKKEQKNDEYALLILFRRFNQCRAQFCVAGWLGADACAQIRVEHPQVPELRHLRQRREAGPRGVHDVARVLAQHPRHPCVLTSVCLHCLGPCWLACAHVVSRCRAAMRPTACTNRPPSRVNHIGVACCLADPGWKNRREVVTISYANADTLRSYLEHEVGDLLKVGDPLLCSYCLLWVAFPAFPVARFVVLRGLGPPLHGSRMGCIVGQFVRLDDALLMINDASHA